MFVRKNRQPGFTIVELLIVIVVIGILAAITIVAYNGIQGRVVAAVLASDLDSAAKKLKLYQVDNSSYPTSIDCSGSPVANSICLKGSNGTTYTTFTPVNTTSPQTFCITATKGTTSYFINQDSTPTSGGCAITNLARNPKGVGLASSYYGSGWFYALQSTTDTPDVSFGTRSDWHRFMNSVTGQTERMRINLSDLQNGETYTASALFANSGTAAVTFTFDLCDMSTTSYTLQPGVSQRINLTTSRGSYDSTYSFIDVTLTTVGGDGLLITDVMIIKGASQYSYADGNSLGWAWSGAVNGSTSTGPPL